MKYNRKHLDGLVNAWNSFWQVRISNFRERLRRKAKAQGLSRKYEIRSRLEEISVQIAFSSSLLPELDSNSRCCGHLPIEKAKAKHNPAPPNRGAELSYTFEQPLLQFK